MDMLAYFLGRLAEGSTGGTGGINYKSIAYNNDDTITLIGTDDTEHTMVCTYNAEGVLVSLTYDDEAVELSYEGDNLVGVGDTVVDVSNAPITESSVKSYADKIYEYYNIDKTTYPCLAVAVLDEGKTRLIWSTEPLVLNEDRAYRNYTKASTQGLVDETEASVVFGWLKGSFSGGSGTQANWHLVDGTYFANYPIEETDTIKYYPL